MDLILWRHAEAEDEAEGLADLARALTPRGEKQATRMAAWLDRHLPDGARVYTSPALRCEQTVAALGRKARRSRALAPDATVEAVLDAAQWPDARRPVLLVSHQPVLGQVIAHLLDIQGGQCPVRKGALWWLRTRERDGQRQTVVWAMQSPETV